jgi:Family of unknown function (DUF6455)
MDSMLLRMLDQYTPEMAGMLQRLGITSSEVVAHRPGLTSVAIKNCIRCPTKAVCRAWQASEEDLGEPPAFCPNAVLFHQWCAEQPPE